jgi:hypothetical protein
MSKISWDDVSTRAKNEINQIESQWKKNIELIGERQLSPDDVRRLYHDLDAVKRQFHWQYQSYVDDDIIHDMNTIFDRLYTDFNLSIQKGQQNYRKQKQEYTIKLLTGIGKIVGIFFVALLALLGVIYGLHIQI